MTPLLQLYWPLIYPEPIQDVVFAQHGMGQWYLKGWLLPYIPDHELRSPRDILLSASPVEETHLVGVRGKTFSVDPTNYGTISSREVCLTPSLSVFSIVGGSCKQFYFGFGLD